MKIKFAVLISCLAFFTCSGLYACGSCNTSSAPLGYCSSYDNGCNCTDPECYSNNPCLSREKCCNAFGNVGGEVTFGS